MLINENKTIYINFFREMSKFIFIPPQTRNTVFIVFEIVKFCTLLLLKCN